MSTVNPLELPGRRPVRYKDMIKITSFEKVTSFLFALNFLIGMFFVAMFFIKLLPDMKPWLLLGTMRTCLVVVLPQERWWVADGLWTPTVCET